MKTTLYFETELIKDIFLKNPAPWPPKLPILPT